MNVSNGDHKVRVVLDFLILFVFNIESASGYYINVK